MGVVPGRLLAINFQLHAFGLLGGMSLPVPPLKIQSLLPAPGLLERPETCLTGDGSHQTLKEDVQR
jgi:hypothetical protein